MKNKKFILINSFSAITLSFILAPIALASAFDTILKGFSLTGKSAGYSLGADGKPAVEFVPAWTRYLNGMLLLMGALFMINIIYAGYLWFMAKGNEEQVTRAKSLMINAFIGLAIILGALIIVQVVLFVLGQTIKTA